MIPDYQIHELAEAFPPMEGKAFDALVADIKKHRLLNAITLCDGKIIDGRNRYRACKMVEAEGEESGCFFEAMDGVTREEIVQLVVSRNFHRRHLNESQRAMVAARLAREGVSLGLAAEQMAVSEETVRKASNVLSSPKAENVISMVDRARVSVHRATRYVAGEITEEELVAKRKRPDEHQADTPRPRGRPAGNARVNTLLRALEALDPLLDGRPVTEIVENFPPTRREQLVKASALLRAIEDATRGENRSIA